MKWAEIEHDGIRWIDIRIAARRASMVVDDLRALVAKGEVQCWEHDGKHWVPRSAVMRLKRENAFMRGFVKDNAARRGARGGRIGPHAAREVQPVLPMSSGRDGQGWAGQPPRK